MQTLIQKNQALRPSLYLKCLKNALTVNIQLTNFNLMKKNENFPAPRAQMIPQSQLKMFRSTMKLTLVFVYNLSQFVFAN